MDKNNEIMADEMPVKKIQKGPRKKGGRMIRGLAPTTMSVHDWDILTSKSDSVVARATLHSLVSVSQQNEEEKKQAASGRKMQCLPTIQNY